MSEAFSTVEREFLSAGYRWIDDNADLVVEFLEELVARPSVTGDEGTTDDPDSTVGYLWRFLDEHGGDAVELDSQRVPDAVEYLDCERENVYAVLPGAGDGGFVGLSHTDVVSPGTYADWPDDDPFDVSRGVVRWTDSTEIEIDVDGETVRREIRENLARVWEQRDFESAEVLIGRGVYDNKACSACLVGSLLGAVAALEETGSRLAGDFVHAHLVDEEQNEVGIQNMVGWEGDPGNLNWFGDRYDSYEGFSAVLLEGQYGFVPVVGHRGGINLTLRASGQAAHGSTPQLGRNAVLGMAKAIARMDTDEFMTAITEPFVDDPLLGELTVAPGTTVVGGGIQAIDPETGSIERSGQYSVPDWCEATVDCRVPRWEGYPDGGPAIEEAVIDIVSREANDAAGDVDIAVDSEIFFYPIALGWDEADASDHPLVRTAKRCTNDVCGYTPETSVAPGATDAWVFNHGTQVPTLVEYGPAGALSHEALEFVERDQVIDGAKALLNMAVRELGVQS